MILSPLQYFQVLQPQPLFYSGLRARLKSILLSECSSSVEVGAPLRPNYLVQYWVGRGRGRGRGRRTWWGESVGGKPSRYCHIELLFGEWFLMCINYTLLFILDSTDSGAHYFCIIPFFQQVHLNGNVERNIVIVSLSHGWSQGKLRAFSYKINIKIQF